MNIVQYYGLKPADRILTPKSGMGIIQHHAVYLGQNHVGQDLIAENAFGKYVRIVTTEQFFREYPTVTKIEPFKGTEWQRTEAIHRALEMLNEPYSLINFNCEHFVNVVQFNRRESKQVRLGVLFILILLFVFFTDQN